MPEPASPDGRRGDELRAPAASPRGATPLAVAALLCALVAIPSGLAMVLGPAGMALGAVAYVKGSRLGMPAAVLAGLATVAGMAVLMLLR